MNKQYLLKVAKPILFSTPMVQVILDGRKTVTRRVIKSLPTDAEFVGWLLDSTIQEDAKDIGKAGFKTKEPTEKMGCVFVKPPYKIGDILYVRETFGKYKHGQYHYRADYPKHDCELYPIWHPSIHMPKEAARIFLKVTDVRVERLQDITEEQAIKEGVKDPYEYQDSKYYEQKHFDGIGINKCAFAGLWDNLNEKRGYSWKFNPWAWVIEFEKAEVENEC